VRLYVSIKPKRIGGGSNSFAYNLARWARRHDHRMVNRPEEAERAIIIAHYGQTEALDRAREAGCRVIHRLDEFFEENEDEYRRAKHARLIELNRHTDVTVFQSQAVYDNVYPHVRPSEWAIIHNGADPTLFYPARQPGRFVGHVTWSVHPRKGLSALHERIADTPGESFLLMGRHSESPLDFRLPNVRMVGRVGRRRLRRYYQRMKLLYFPSENEPCPNIVIEAIMCGVPVCYHPSGGTVELVRDCGEPLERFDHLLANLDEYRERCLARADLHFGHVAERYMAV
jgi:glycosyltransferase involved in cell wall biosynthesis